MRLMVSLQGENLDQKTPLRGTAQMRLENGLIRYTFTSISFYFRNKYFVLSYVSKNELSRGIAPNTFCEWLKNCGLNSCIDSARGLHFKPITEPFACCCHFSGAFLFYQQKLVCRMDWKGCFHPLYNWIIAAIFSFCSCRQKTWPDYFFLLFLGRNEEVY